ncbi:MAG TPA: methionyl-tRNA formyltransferase [Acidimicrobiales bacterium]|nr:methionyl-tRNA formyltransferase [Acidimicrobiales bacterium]
MVFLGSPPAAATALRALHSAGHEVALVVTRPDKRRGRGNTTSPTAVAQAAGELGLTATSDIAEAKAAGAELGVVVAYGRIIKPDILAALPMVNIHFSLLPRWRGAAPVERAILAGDEVTGVCLMDVEEGLDTGAVYRRREVAIGPEETAAQLTARLAEVGAGLLVTALEEGLGEPVPQQGEPTYAAKIEAEDLHLDWARPALDLHRIVRVGRAWTTWKGRRLLVLEASPAEAPGGPPGTVSGDVVAAGTGGLRLVTVQPEGKRAMPAADWLRGAGTPLQLG